MSTTTTTYRCPHCDTPIEIENSDKVEKVICHNPDCGREFDADESNIESTHEGPVYGRDENGGAAVAPERALGGEEQRDREREEDRREEARREQQREEERRVPEAVPVAGTTGGQDAPPAEPVGGGHNQVIFSAQRSPMFRRQPVMFIGYLVLVVLGLVGLVWGLVRGFVFLTAIAFLAACSALVFLAYSWLKVKRTQIVLTNTSLVVTKGILFQHTQEVRLDTITNIDVYQPWGARHLKAGALQITYQDPNGPQTLYIRSVKNPWELVDVIRRQIQK